jgi:hypothetical protein
MPTITYDGQSLVLDGRRVWLVSGSVPYFRIPRAEWADRLHQARLAGLNTVETPVVWARHEVRPGQFDFTGENDLRHFVELVQHAGLLCILRVGPYIGSGYDNGGLPPWMIETATMRLRTNAQPFLEASSRFISALAAQVRNLQAVVAPVGRKQKEEASTGPIILIQNEMGWTCGFDTLAASYLGELDRYYREAGFAVPVVNANDLWQSVEGEIDGWTGSSNMLAHLRQLATIRPTQPRMVMDLRLGRTDVWGKPASGARTPDQAVRAMAEVLAAAGQYNISPFAGGTNFGFAGGGAPGLSGGLAGGGGEGAGIHDFAVTSQDCGAPLDEIGRPGPLFSAVRRVSTFASRFARILSQLEPQRHAVTLLPAQPATASVVKGNQRRTSTPTGAASPGSVSVVHASGSQGGVVFLFNDRDESHPDQQHTLLLPDGSTLPVDLRGMPVAWVLLDARLTGRAQIDYCNLSAFALVGKVFVCFGPAGSRGVLSINGSPLETLVPAAGKPPIVLEHEGLTLVVTSTQGLDTIFCDDAHVYVGVAGIDRAGKPVPLPESRSCVVLDAEGKASTVKFPVPAPARKHHRLEMGEWQTARTEDYVLGESPRFAAIKTPEDLVTLGAPYGYGWYRFRFNSGSAHKVRVAFPQSNHRLHLAVNGEHAGIVGVGPGAAFTADLHLKKKAQSLVVLAENFGRASGGVDLGERVGIFGEPWIVSHLRLPKPRLVPSEPVDLIKFKAPLWRVHEDDVTDATRLTWTIQHRKKTPVIVRLDDVTREDDSGRGPGSPWLLSGGAGVILLNDQPIRYFHAGGCPAILLTPEQLSRGNNELQVAMVGSTAALADALTKALNVEECETPLSEKGDWAFAKWEPPPASAYGKPARSAGAASTGTPAWHRATFTAPDDHAPLFFDASGLSKGQIYVNGRHLGRYFVATADGKSVPPQKRYWIPRSFLHADAAEDNQIVIFDEHGFSPSKARIIADAAAHTIEA